jgi:hypothetical protein
MFGVWKNWRDYWIKKRKDLPHEDIENTSNWQHLCFGGTGPLFVEHGLCP